MTMPAWLIAGGQISLAAALATYALVIILSPLPRTRLLFLLAGTALAASTAAFFHFFVFKIAGWPALLTGIFIWIASYASFKHRLALDRSIIASRNSRRYGRRYND